MFFLPFYQQKKIPKYWGKIELFYFGLLEVEVQAIRLLKRTNMWKSWKYTSEILVLLLVCKMLMNSKSN
jgi:hypothetical protein